MTSKPLRLLGIDPGIHGAISLLEYHEGHTTILACDPLPISETLQGKDQLNIPAFASYLQSNPSIALCALEQQGPRSTDGAASIFTTGRFFGRLETCLALASIPTTCPIPQTWKKVVFAGSGITLQGKERAEQKAAAIAFVKSRFPNLSLRRTRLARTDDDNMAESVCLALYALQYLHMSLRQQPSSPQEPTSHVSD